MSTPSGTLPAPNASANIAVLASGGGSNLQVLLDHFGGPGAHAGRIVWVGSDKPTAGALTRASNAGVPTGVVTDPRGGDALVATLRSAGADLLVLAGYLKLIPEAVVQALSKALGEVANDPAIRAALEAQAMVVPRPQALPALAKVYSDNTAKYRAIAKAMNLQPQ